MRLVRWVVGLVLFVPFGILIISYVVVVIVFLRCGFLFLFLFFCVWAGVVDLGGGLYRLEL